MDYFEFLMIFLVFVFGCLSGGSIASSINDDQQKNHCESSFHMGEWVDHGTQEYCFTRDGDTVIYRVN